MRYNVYRGENYCAGNTAWSKELQQCLGLTMQSFTSDMCNAFVTPTGPNYTNVGTLIDERDGKAYDIRKYSDGHCWMAQNLQFGTYCSTSVSFNTGNTNYTTAYVGTYGGHSYYGRCRPAESGYDGYYYDWEATMNNSTATHNNNYVKHDSNNTFGNGTTLATHDICPLGWHVPIGGTGGEFKSLADKIQGSSVGSNVGSNCGKNTCVTAYNFFYSSGNSSWNATSNSSVTGVVDSRSAVYKGQSFHLWSSTESSEIYAYILHLNTSAIYPMNNGSKVHGFPVRCVADY